jgi:hypothetical protein
MLDYLFGQSLANRLKSRDDIDLGEIYSDLDPEKKCIQGDFESLWSQAAKILGVSPSKLRLEDRFAKELRSKDGLFGVNDELDSLIEWAGFIAETRGKQIQFSDLVTLRDLMRCLLLK